MKISKSLTNNGHIRKVRLTSKPAKGLNAVGATTEGSQRTSITVVSSVTQLKTFIRTNRTGASSTNSNTPGEASKYSSPVSILNALNTVKFPGAISATSLTGSSGHIS